MAQVLSVQNLERCHLKLIGWPIYYSVLDSHRACPNFAIPVTVIILATLDSGAGLPSLADVMIFFSGADQEPPLGFQTRPSLRFADGPLATASACICMLHLPKHSTYEVFRDKMTLSILGHGGFDRI